jgi:acyl-CoA synthetase (NDP forming)
MSGQDILNQYAPLFSPHTVAVVGASSSGNGRQNTFIRRIRDLGFGGAIYPIHPTAREIDGLPAYPTLGATPQPIDYAFIGISGAAVPDVLTAGAGRVRFAQVISSGFGETEGGMVLQERLVATARAGGMRLLGPNCLGIYTPRGRITFTETKSQELGSVGIISQSGGLGTDIVRRGTVRGLRFSGVVTLGNCADLGSSDLLEFYLADPQTKIIGLYIEAAKDGRRLFEILRAAKAVKPVVILKGGRTNEGGAAASSHTGALAGDYKVWVALSRQTGCVLVDTLDRFLDTLLIFQQLTPRIDRDAKEPPRIVLLGNGGGTSVLAADYFSDLGLPVVPFEKMTRDALSELNFPAGTSVANPIDCPAGALQQEDGLIAEKLLDAVYQLARPGVLIMHLNMTPFVGRAKPRVLENLMKAVLRVQTRYPGQAHFMLVLRSDGEPRLETRKRSFRKRALKFGIPVFDELSNAGHALAALRQHECFIQSRTLEHGQV